MRFRRALIGGAVAALIGVIGLVALWFTVLRSDAPPAVTIEQAISAIASPSAEAGTPDTPTSEAPAPDLVAAQDGGGGGTLAESPETTATESAVATHTSTPTPTQTATVTATPTATPSPTPQANHLIGAWVISDQGESFVGYRVQEELAFAGFNTAVGRTSAVTGNMTYDGQAITALTVVADMTQLVSDDPRREKHLRGKSLETNIFKTATFVLAVPIAVGAVEDGDRVNATAIGDLTIHGVTHRVAINLQGQLMNELVVIVGSLEIQFADYDVDTPTSGLVLSVEDHGIMELQLVFEHA